MNVNLRNVSLIYVCFTLQECAKEQECANYNLTMQITPYFILFLFCFIHVLECTLKNIHTKFGCHRCCNKCFRAF